MFYYINYISIFHVSNDDFYDFLSKCDENNIYGKYHTQTSLSDPTMNFIMCIGVTFEIDLTFDTIRNMLTHFILNLFAEEEIKLSSSFYLI